MASEWQRLFTMLPNNYHTMPGRSLTVLHHNQQRQSPPISHMDKSEWELTGSSLLTSHFSPRRQLLGFRLGFL